MLRARTLAQWESDHRPVATLKPGKPDSPPLDWEWERKAARWYALVVVLLACLGVWQIQEDRNHQALVRAEQQRRAMLALELEPAPTVGYGPKQRQKDGKWTSTWVVAGAGDATYDGTYRRSGVFNGWPAYTNGRRWLWRYVEGNWLLTDELGVAAPEAPYSSCPGELPANPWVALVTTGSSWWPMGPSQPSD